MRHLMRHSPDNIAIFRPGIKLDIIITGVCETDQPSMSPPEVTQSAEGEIQCSAGSSKLDSE